MKKFTMFLMAGLLSAFVLTSCIDNTVSEGIEAIRQAHANLLNAKAELESANAAYRQAQARYVDAETANLNEDTEAKDIQNREALLTLAKNTADAATYVKNAELELQQAVDALAKYIAEQGLADAADYLDKYQDAIDNARDVADEIADINYTISLLELFLEDPSGNGGGRTLAMLRADREADLANEQAILAVMELALEALEAVEADPSSAVAEAIEIQAQIQEKENELLALNVDLEKANVEASKLEDAANALEDLIDEFEDLEDDMADLESDLASYQATLAAYQVTKTNTEASIAAKNTLLNNYTAGLETNFTNFKNRRNAAYAALAVVQNRFTQLDILVAQQTANPESVTAGQITTAQNNVNTALNDYVAIVGGTALTYTDGYAAADARKDAPVDISSSATDYESYKAIYDNQKINFTAAQPAYVLINDIGLYSAANFLTNFENTGTIASIPFASPPTGLTLTLLNTNNNIEQTNADIAKANDDIADLQIVIDSKQAAYDAAVADLEDAWDAVDVAWDAWWQIYYQQDIVIDEINYLWNIYWAIDGYVTSGSWTGWNNSYYVDGINDLIEDLKEDIADQQDAVADAELDLIKVDFDETHAQETLAKEQDYLVGLQAKLAAFQAEAARYLSLLMAALG